MGRNALVTKSDLALMLQNLRCEHLHHKPSEYHSPIDDCPVVRKLMEKYVHKTNN